jgi:hypothetical protein
MLLKEECKMACQAYRTTSMRLRLTRKKWDKDAPARLEALNAYYDAIQDLLPGQSLSETKPELAKSGSTVESECSEFHSNVNAIRKMHFEQLKTALATIGTTFGSAMLEDRSGSLGQRFRKHWRQANVYRKQLLDGIELHGLHFDENGPMFVAFAKALGMTARLLAADLRLESNMRSGRCSVDLDDAIRLGITTA